jgi:hypothetical protein
VFVAFFGGSAVGGVRAVFVAFFGGSAVGRLFVARCSWRFRRF